MEPASLRLETRTAIQALLDETGAALGGVLRSIRLLINGAAHRPLTPANVRHIVKNLLSPAEAFLRRTIHQLADLQPLPAAKSLSRPSAPSARAAPGAPPTRAAVFRLGEPAPRGPRNLPLSQRPQVSVAGTAPPPPRRTPDPAEPETRLLRRLAAFEAAFNDPERAAQRLLRRRACAEAAKDRPVKVKAASALALASRNDPLLASILEWINTRPPTRDTS